jgi:hypothetical protein
MILNKAHDVLLTQANFGGFYNRHGAKLILELNPGEIFQFQPGDAFESSC